MFLCVWIWGFPPPPFVQGKTLVLFKLDVCLSGGTVTFFPRLLFRLHSNRVYMKEGIRRRNKCQLGECLCACTERVWGQNAVEVDLFSDPALAGHVIALTLSVNRKRLFFSFLFLRCRVDARAK